MALTPEELIKQRELAEQLLKNKLLRTSNFLDYTSLTYEDIMTSINSKLVSDTNYDNFRESSIVKLLLEIFAGSSDLVNYYIERTAEECFFDTAKLKSSLILLSRSLAYDITRPISSQCRIKVILKGDFSSSTYSVGDVIQIPQYTNFTFEGNNFLLMKQFNYTLTSSDLDQGSDYSKEIYYNEVNDSEDSNIRLMQGDRKVSKILGNMNPKINQIFQKYKISDKTFSNYYGDRDLISPLTEVGIGETINDAFPNGISEWEIDRRTLLRTDSIEQYDFTSEINQPKKICLLRTGIDEGVELLFGDNKYTAIGLTNLNQNIFIKYLSTLGSLGNKTGVIGNKGTILSSITLRNVDITSQIEFELISNITMGSDIESNESIKINSPRIFYTLDRLVTKQDYVNFLESLTSPIYIKNAISWGEQEEIKSAQLYNSENRMAIKKLFNVVLFSAIGSMYNTSPNLDNFSIKQNLSDENVVLDSDFRDNEISSQSFFNLFTIDQESGGNIVEEIKNQTIVSQGDNSNIEYLIINGASVPYDINTFTNYRAERPFTIYYTSAADITTYNAEGVTSANFLIESIRNFNSFEEICVYITNIVRAENILPDDFVCYWDEENLKFNMKHKIIEGQNYIVDIIDYSNLSYLTLNLQRSGYSLSRGRYTTVSYVDKNISYSQNITQVINELNKRSQITIKNVYISPIVHNFNLVGNVYVNNLVDKDLMRTRICNKLYSWLDDKIDFNVEIYKSNLIEIIESFPNVVRADVKIEPEVLLRSDGKFNFISGLNENYEVDYDLDQESKNRSVYWKAEAIGFGSQNSLLAAKIMQEEINKFKSLYLSDSSNFYNNVINGDVWDVEVYNKVDNFNNKINERFFFSKLAKPIYERVKAEVIGNNFDNSNAQYYQTSLFLDAISQIHKDLLYIIRMNMLDSEGNIASEYNKITVSNKELLQLVRGGYSLGNEIVKMFLAFQVLYR
jgi:hypothetical protein